MKNPEIVQIETSRLTLNSKNPRKNDEAVDTVAKSIEKYGFKNPIIADKNLVVYCGNTKYCDVIIKRWKTLTGQKAVRLNG